MYKKALDQFGTRTILPAIGSYLYGTISLANDDLVGIYSRISRDRAIRKGRTECGDEAL
jgi:hypothetical protein